MRGGGGAATLAALPTPLGLVLLNAPLSAPAFGRPPPRFPVAAAPPPNAPPLRANEAAGMAKTMNNAIVTFTEVFDIGNLRSLDFPLERVKLTVGRQSTDTIKFCFRQNTSARGRQKFESAAVL